MLKISHQGDMCNNNYQCLNDHSKLVAPAPHSTSGSDPRFRTRGTTATGTPSCSVARARVGEPARPDRGRARARCAIHPSPVDPLARRLTWPCMGLPSGRLRKVAIAITTRMAYFRGCLTTGSKGEPARIILRIVTECGDRQVAVSRRVRWRGSGCLMA